MMRQKMPPRLLVNQPADTAALVSCFIIGFSFVSLF